MPLHFNFSKSFTTNALVNNSNVDERSNTTDRIVYELRLVWARTLGALLSDGWINKETWSPSN